MLMKILHTISSIDLSGGGPSKSVSDLALKFVCKSGCENISSSCILKYSFAGRNKWISINCVCKLGC